MATQFKLPELGENITSGTIVKVLVSVGDSVKKDQPVLEMETDKAVVEVPSSVDGKVAEIHVKAGDKATVGQLILTLDGGASAEAPAPAPEKKKAEPEKKSEPPPPAEKEEPALVSEPAASAASSGAPVAASPSVRKFAREIGIEIQQVPGSGDNGRVTIEDVKAYAKRLNTGRQTAPAGAPATPTYQFPDFAKWGPIERQGMSAIRTKTAQHMSLSWSAIPHVTQFDWADITDIEERRKKLSKKAEKAGAKLTITAILIKIVAAALKNFPKFNATIDTTRGEIVLKKYYNVGIAVDTERGLLVPVVRQVDQKNIIQIAVEMAQLAEKSRAGKLSLEEMQGGTFTVTNLGGIGGTHFTPIVNFPEVAILGVGRARLEPSFSGKEGCCSPKLMLPLSLSYDHRLIDGADGARFLRWIVEAIEEPLLIPMEG
jgi:pyruvate dehydrogenase E2 component (dihydrolipoamide acetyltransferase)